MLLSEWCLRNVVYNLFVCLFICYLSRGEHYVRARFYTIKQVEI